MNNAVSLAVSSRVLTGVRRAVAEVQRRADQALYHAGYDVTETKAATTRLIEEAEAPGKQCAAPGL